jgi:3-isopropylmalate/(R)-2-methylmalate dehydratase large subunit
LEKPGRTLLAKIWDQHVIAHIGDDTDLLHVDRHLLHDLGGSRGLLDLKSRNLSVHNPELTFATPDHAISTARGRAGTSKIGPELLAGLRAETSAAGIEMFDIDEPGQGIVHVIGPELGLSLPGCLIVCGDSHTCTHGGLGALAFGIGSSELTHVLATQAIIQRRPKTMRAMFEGRLPFGVTAKDLILATLGQLGVGGMTGHVVEYSGPAIQALSMEGRMTVCNMTIEGGGRAGMVAPDETTFAWFTDRQLPGAPKGADLHAAVEGWRELHTEDGASFDREVIVDATAISPQVTWGTNPGMVRAVTESVPAPEDFDSPADREATERALAYMALEPGTPIQRIAIDRVFIGSCTNSRIGDLRAAAEVVAGRKVASSVNAMVVPGSQQVKAQAEAEGLDEIFRDAGFDWRVAGCSMCLGMNPDILQPGERCASTSNRNFEGRQGRGGRTHLVSPQMAAAAAIEGHFVDIRDWS